MVVNHARGVDDMALGVYRSGHGKHEVRGAAQGEEGSGTGGDCPSPSYHGTSGGRG